MPPKPGPKRVGGAKGGGAKGAKGGSAKAGSAKGAKGGPSKPKGSTGRSVTGPIAVNSRQSHLATCGGSNMALARPTGLGTGLIRVVLCEARSCSFRLSDSLYRFTLGLKQKRISNMLLDKQFYSFINLFDSTGNVVGNEFVREEYRRNSGHVSGTSKEAMSALGGGRGRLERQMSVGPSATALSMTAVNKSMTNLFLSDAQKKGTLGSKGLPDRLKYGSYFPVSFWIAV
eukprot:sb/3469453/